MLGWLRVHLPKRWLLMLVFLFLLGDYVDTTLMALSKPSDRLTVTISAAQVRVKTRPRGSFLLEDDVILAVDGVPVDSPLLLRPNFWHHRIRTILRRGSPPQPLYVEYTVLRDGEELKVPVEWRPYTFPEWLQRVWGLYVGALVLLIVAVLVIWEQKREYGTRMMAAMLLTIAFLEINNLLPASSLTLLLEFGWWFIPVDVLAVIATTLITPFTFLVFPRPVSWMENRRRRRLLFLAATMVVVLPVAGILLFHHGSLLTVREAVFRYLNPLMLLALLFSVGRMTYNAFRAPDPLERAQLRWMMLGAAIALAPFVFFYLIPILLIHAPLLPLTITNTAVLAFPIAVLVAIFRYGLVEIDRTISRVMSWFLVVVLALLVYRPIAIVIHRIWEWLMMGRQTVDINIVITVLVVLVALSLEPLIRQLVDTLFAREWRDFDAAMGEISERLTRVVNYRELFVILEQELPYRLGLHGAFVLSLDERRGSLERDGVPFHFPVHSPLVRWLEAHGSLLSVYHLRHVPREVREVMFSLAEEGVEVVVPIFLHDRVVALYLMMARRSANLFKRRELEALALFGHQLSTTMQNANLYQQLQDYNRMLEARVEERTRELQTERNRLNAILQNLADGLVVTDPDGVITLVNPAFLRLVGRKEEEVLGRALLELLPLEGLRRLEEETLRRPGEIVALTIVQEEERRAFKASACTLGPVGGAGAAEVAGVVIVLHDITRERELDQMKTDFLSTVSHELRTPLTAILGFAKLVLRTLERQIEPLVGDAYPREQRALQRAEDNLHIIVNEGERLTQLINDLLDISRLEAGRMQWHMEMIDLTQVVQQAVSAVHSLAEDKHLPLWVRSDESLPPVRADAQRMMQVVINLLSNAIKFTEAGQVVVRLATVTVDAEGRRRGGDLGSRPPDIPPGRWMLLRVEDTGIGIAEEDLTIIFDRFRQAEGAMNERPQGTGLGLAICREIVRAHHGYIWAESRLGEGSTFFVLLPLEVEAAQA